MKGSDSLSASDGISIMQSAIVVAVKISAPILLFSMLIGIIISIFQAATQIHEQTITFVPKLLIIAIVLFSMGAWMLQTLMDFTNQIFTIIQG